MDINEMAEALEQQNADGTITTDIPAEAYAVYADDKGYTLDDFEDWRGEAEEAYQGDYPSDEEFARFVASNDWPASYVDWERAAHDLMFDYFTDRGYYFRNM